MATGTINRPRREQPPAMDVWQSPRNPLTCLERVGGLKLPNSLLCLVFAVTEGKGWNLAARPRWGPNRVKTALIQGSNAWPLPISVSCFCLHRVSYTLAAGAP